LRIGETVRFVPPVDNHDGRPDNGLRWATVVYGADEQVSRVSVLSREPGASPRTTSWTAEGGRISGFVPGAGDGVLGEGKRLTVDPGSDQYGHGVFVLRKGLLDLQSGG
jgi:hypothetical protein